MFCLTCVNLVPCQGIVLSVKAVCFKCCKTSQFQHSSSDTANAKSGILSELDLLRLSSRQKNGCQLGVREKAGHLVSRHFPSYQWVSFLSVFSTWWLWRSKWERTAWHCMRAHFTELMCRMWRECETLVPALSTQKSWSSTLTTETKQKCLLRTSEPFPQICSKFHSRWAKKWIFFFHGSNSYLAAFLAPIRGLLRIWWIFRLSSASCAQSLHPLWSVRTDDGHEKRRRPSVDFWRPVTTCQASCTSRLTVAAMVRWHVTCSVAKILWN